MLPSDLTIEVRDLSLTRSAQILPQYWSDVKAILNYRKVGSWSLSLPFELPAAQALAQPGAGILVTGPNGVILSGPMDSVNRKQSSTDALGTYFYTGVTDDCILGDALAWPDPANVVASQTLAYDVRSGAAESVIRGLVDVNVGPSAQPARRGVLAQKLTLGTDLARGTVVPSSARFPKLLDQMYALASTGGIGYRVIQSGATLLLEFWVPTDRSKSIRLDVANGRLTSSEYALAAPVVTRAIVGGQGEGVARTLLERTNTDATAAEAAWGRRIEEFKDRRDSNLTADLQQSGDEMLAIVGKTQVTTKITPTDDLTMRFQRDWNLGDIVSVVVGETEVPEVVTSVGLGITKTGVTIGARVGEGSGA